MRMSMTQDLRRYMFRFFHGSVVWWRTSDSGCRGCNWRSSFRPVA